MHELSICQALIEQVEMIAQQRNATRINKIMVQIGPLSGVESHLLAQAYSLASVGSVAQYAELVIEQLPVRIHCEECGKETNAQANKLICGACGNWRTQMLSGDEMLLKSIEMTSEDKLE